MTRGLRTAALAALVLLFLGAGPALAQGPASGLTEGGVAEESVRLSTAVEIAILMTVLSVLPALLVTLTSFTRVVIVLSFVRRALAVQELPPNPVLIGLALFLTSFIMAPVAEGVYEEAWQPYRAEEIGAMEATEAAWGEMSAFLYANTRSAELELFAELAELQPPPDGGVMDMPPARVLVPAFILSELKTAFQMGFLLFLPFLVIDMVIASVLLSMGMFMLPPVMISTPIKILIFVLVDGWTLISRSVVESFVLL